MELNNFLVRAKVNTYANSGEGMESKLEDGSRELVYKEEGWTYRDRYFGFNPFFGEEIIWKNKRVVWGMNYYGKILSEAVSDEKIYEFLKKALLRVDKSMPFRGLKALDEGDFNYRNSASGSVEEFHGVEMILYQGKRVYELKYHGGIIKSSMADNDSKSLQIAKKFLGKEVEIMIDRPIGSRHPKHDFIYEANYGYVPDVKAPDGEDLDAYYLGVSQSLKKARGVVAAIIHRPDDDDDKLVVVPQGTNMTDEEIEKQISFQEKWFKHEIVRIN